LSGEAESPERLGLLEVTQGFGEGLDVILDLTHRLVTRHLTALAGFLGAYDLRRPPPPLRLQRRPPKDMDELDHLVAAFENMRQTLERAYHDLRASEQRFRDYAETASDRFWATANADHGATFHFVLPRMRRS
jgi:HAMP domain-containing protein